MVDMLKNEGTRRGKQVMQLLGQPRKGGGPTGDRAGLPAHQLDCPPSKAGLPPACRRNEREQKDPRVTVLGAEPDPHDTVTMLPQSGRQSLGDQVARRSGEDGVSTPGCLIEDLVLGSGI